MEDIGEPRVSLRTTHEYKKRKGLGPRARLAATEIVALQKTTPVLKPWVDHVRDRFPEKADVLDLARHDTTGFALPSQASTREDISFKRAGKAAAAEQRRKEFFSIESEDKLMADYVDLCTQESNLHDEAVQGCGEGRRCDPAHPPDPHAVAGCEEGCRRRCCRHCP